MGCRWRFGTWLCLLVALGGCDEGSAEQEPKGGGSGADPAQSPAPEPPSAAEDEDAAGADGFEWTPRPTRASIPDVPVGGVVHGAPFDVQTVYFEPRLGQWTLVLADAELEAPTDPPPPDAQMLTITELPEEIGEGVLRREMREVGGSIWRIRPGEDGPLTTWSAPHAFVIEIDEWEVEPWDPKGGIFQEAGRASGRLSVVHRASDGLERAWVAGTFEDAVIRYMGPPR